MQPSTLTVHEIFEKERRYTVPLFQRAYVWTLDRHWEPLWEDIERQAEHCRKAVAEERQVDSTHFLGAVVLNVAKVTGRGLARSEVIDGQQRLTTLQIVLAALRDYADSVGDEIAADVRRLTFNPVRDLNSEELLKVWPTNTDRITFRAVMTAGSADRVQDILRNADDPNETLPRMAEAYRYFSKRIEVFVEGEADDTADASATTTSVRADRLYALLHAFKTNLQMVVIELEERDDPQVIFETLNARGQPLLPSDLIRNTVFLEATGKGKDVDRLYDSYWRPFDEYRIDARDAHGEDRFWHLEERQGRIVRPRIDLFMFHDLTVRTERELNIGRLFREFRDWYSRTDQDVEQYLASVHVRANDFARLVVPDGRDRLSVFARRLRSLDTSTLYPILLLLMEFTREDNDYVRRDQIVNDLESYLVRRFVCQLTTKNYNSFFVSLLHRIGQARRSGEDIAAVVRAELRRPTGPAVVWPSDAEFRAAWLNKTMYVKSRPDRSAMVLKALNEALHNSKSEAIVVSSDLTVEHLMPRSAKLDQYPFPGRDAFPLNEEETLESRRDRLRETVGNLTLLTGPLNSSVSNGPFPDKVREIVTKSDLRLNAEFRNLEQPIECWDERHIVRRGECLFETALSVWPKP